MFPECLHSDGSSWMCARSLSFGTCCLITLSFAVHALRRILPIFIKTRWYSINAGMLSLTVVQMTLLVYECLIKNSSKILVMAKYCRGVQVGISCILYGKLACELMNRTRLYNNLIVPIVVGTLVMMTMNAFFVVMVEDEINCRHLSWLVMSMSGAVLSASFVLPGRVVLDEIKLASANQQKTLLMKSSPPKEMEQSHHQLWILLFFNMVSSTLQLFVDIYISYGSGTKTCNSMFFEDGAGAFEQSFRLMVSVVTYLLPNWATIYVFFLIPRYEFYTEMDLEIPGLNEDNYTLLDKEVNS